MTESALGARAVELGLVRSDDLREMAAAWRRWAEDPDGWFGLLHGEVLCRPEGEPNVEPNGRAGQGTSRTRPKAWRLSM